MKRTLTGLILFAGLMGFILLTGVSVKGVAAGQFVFDAFLLFFCAASTLEMVKVFREKGYKPILAPLILFLAAVYPVTYFFDINGFAVAAAVVFMVAFGCFVFDNKRQLNDFFATLLILIYPLMSFSLSLYLTINFGMLPLLIAAGAAMCADTCAYYFGSLIKGPKIFPKISPKKTYAGSIFGIAGGVLGSALVYLLFELAELPVNDLVRFTDVFTHPILFYLLVGGIIGIVSEIGDLAASRLKRALQIKDFSHAFGPQGGIMDRLDSIIFAILFMSSVMVFVPLQ
jgi:phosphatidate cytidylyltransferase